MVEHSSLTSIKGCVLSKIIVIYGLQLKDLLRRTVEGFVKLFDPKDQQRLPIFKMELMLDDDKMEFYPTFQDLEDAVLGVVERIADAMQVYHITLTRHISLCGSVACCRVS